MNPPPAIPRLLVLACGNAMAGDDAFGPQLVAALERAPIAGVQAVDLGADPSRAVDWLADRPPAVLVVADAVCGDGLPPGRLLEWECSRTWPPGVDGARPESTHGFSIVQALELARRLGQLPASVWLLGFTTVPTCAGAPCSTALRGAVHQAVQRLRTLATHAP